MHEKEPEFGNKKDLVEVYERLMKHYERYILQKYTFKAELELHCTKQKIFLSYRSKSLPNMNTFCNWLSETVVIRVYDLFFRNYTSIVLLSFIVSSSESQHLFI